MGRLFTNGPTANPKPNGMSRESEIERHSKYTPFARGSMSQ